MTQPIEYDSHGRMQYHPDFHAKHKKPWMVAEEKFLIENYETMGAEACSLALERTIHTVMQRACDLRKKGKMPPRSEGAPTIRRSRFESKTA